MNTPSENDVQKAIESSGYPLEIRVAHTLATRDYFDVIPSWDYRDDKTGESREIDVAALRLFDVRHRGKHCHSLMLHLLIECKRSPAFVIYSAHPREILTEGGYDSMSVSYFGRPATMWMTRHETGWSGIEIVDHLKLGTLRWKWPDCVGSHYSFVHAKNDQQRKQNNRMPKFKVGDEDFYHKKLLGLLKGTYKYREPYDTRVLSGPGSVQPHFVIPILVMDADMYEYDVGSASLRRITCAAICRSYRGEFAARFRIDVIQESALGAYLETLENDFSKIAVQIGKEYPLWEQALQVEFEMSTKNAHSTPLPATVP